MADSSFDIVSKIDRQEVDNALNQTAKEVSAARETAVELRSELEVELARELQHAGITRRSNLP